MVQKPQSVKGSGSNLTPGSPPWHFAAPNPASLSTVFTIMGVPVSNPTISAPTMSNPLFPTPTPPLYPLQVMAREAEIKALSEDPQLEARLVASFAPNIWEMEDVKRGLLCQLFGGLGKSFPGEAGRGWLGRGGASCCDVWRGLSWA